MADVLLTHSYHLYYDRKQMRKMQPYPPLGTLYAASLLRSAGLSVAVFDTMLNDPEAGFQAALKQHRPRIVVVFEDNFNFLSKMCLTRMRDVAYHILETSQQAGATVLVNGSDASDHALDYLQKGFRCVLLGEAEWTLLEAVNHLLKGDDDALDQVAGLAYLHKETGEVVKTERRGLMRNLDQLPFPTRDLIDTSQYRKAWKSAHGYFSLNIVASRGCPYRCNWCAKPIYGDSFSVRSAASVAEEMRHLKYDFGAEHLWFADDIFGLQPKWVRELASEVQRLDAAIPFKMQSRVDLMSPDNVSALRRAGCAEVWMGAESGSQKISGCHGQRHAGRSNRQSPRKSQARRNSSLLLPAIRISRRNLERYSEHDQARSRYTSRRHWRLGLIPATRNQIFRPRAGATRRED